MHSRRLKTALDEARSSGAAVAVERDALRHDNARLRAAVEASDARDAVRERRLAKAREQKRRDDRLDRLGDVDVIAPPPGAAAAAARSPAESRGVDSPPQSPAATLFAAVDDDTDDGNSLRSSPSPPRKDAGGFRCGRVVTAPDGTMAVAWD